MSLPVFVWVLDTSETTLGARLVMLVLAEHAHDDGSGAYPSLDTIARRCRMSRKGVRDALERLVKDGHIKADGHGTQGQTKWRILFKEGSPPSLKPSPEGGCSSYTLGGVVPSAGGVVPSPKTHATTPEPSVKPSEKGSTARVPSRTKTSRKPTARQLETYRELATETGETVQDLDTFEAVSAEIIRLIALKRTHQRQEPYDPPEPQWTAVKYDSDRIVVHTASIPARETEAVAA